MIRDQNKRIRDFYLKELKMLNENDKKSWPAETPQIDITYIRGK